MVIKGDSTAIYQNSEVPNNNQYSSLYTQITVVFTSYQGPFSL